MAALIPYQKFEIKTRFNRETTREKLAAIIEPRKLRWGFSRANKPFEGELNGYTFKISRTIGYRNNFLPILVGHIQDDLDASSLQITARPNLATAIVWPIVFIIFMGTTLFGANVTNPFFFLLLIAFFYGLPTVLFNFELNKAKKLLNEQLETKSFSLP